jgi:cbb3-type cytochrome oxidase cytochrome c subunit
VSAIGLLLALLALVVGVRAHAAKESLAPQFDRQVGGWMRAERLPRSAVPGMRLFVASGCLTCHTYLGAGSRNLGAPDLTAEGRRGRGVAWQVRHLASPASVVPGSPMPSFEALGRPRLRQLAIFLEASKGRR